MEAGALEPVQSIDKKKAGEIFQHLRNLFTKNGHGSGETRFFRFDGDYYSIEAKSDWGFGREPSEAQKIGYFSIYGRRGSLIAVIDENSIQFYSKSAESFMKFKKVIDALLKADVL